MMSITGRVLGAVLAAVTLGLPAAGTAAAAPAVPNGCDPSRLQGEVAAAPSAGGYRHYRVTLFSGPDASPCAIAGPPYRVSFDRGGARLPVRAGSYGDRTVVARLSQGSPVHFDVEVPVSAPASAADGITFTLRAPDGSAAAAPSRVAGSLTAGPGTRVGPVRPGV